MITHTTVQALGQARLADLHDQARRDALVRAARQGPRRPAAAVPGSAPGRADPAARDLGRRTEKGDQDG
jgi:hypothetical protein